MKKDEFIKDTSVRIYAAMFANPEKEPSTQVAVDSAIKLWEQLVSEGIEPSAKSSDNTRVYI